MAIFAREVIGRMVVDSHGEILGTLNDLIFDIPTGAITEMRVEIEADLDASRLPWAAEDRMVMIPVDEVERVAARIHLKR